MGAASPVEALEQWIRELDLKPGDRIPSERRVAEALKLSRGKVRETLKTLAAQGRVTVRRGSGYFLRDPAPVAPERLLSVLGTKVRVSDIFEVRRALELSAIRLAAAEARAEEIDRLDALCAAMEALAGQKSTNATLARFVRQDAAFHLAVAEATHNPLFPYLLQALAEVFEQVSWSASRRRGARAHAVDYHQKLARAIRERDGEYGAAVMLLHLNDAMALMEAQMATSEDS